MISWIIFGLFLLIGLGWLFVTRDKAVTKTDAKSVYDSGTTSLNLSWLIKPVITIVLGILLAIFQPYTVERVDSSGVGFRINLTGNERGISNYQYRTGWVVYNTWDGKLPTTVLGNNSNTFFNLK